MMRAVDRVLTVNDALVVHLVGHGEGELAGLVLAGELLLHHARRVGRRHVVGQRGPRGQQRREQQHRY